MKYPQEEPNYNQLNQNNKNASSSSFNNGYQSQQFQKSMTKQSKHNFGNKRNSTNFEEYLNNNSFEDNNSCEEKLVNLYVKINNELMHRDQPVLGDIFNPNYNEYMITLISIDTVIARFKILEERQQDQISSINSRNNEINMLQETVRNYANAVDELTNEKGNCFSLFDKKNRALG